MQKGVVQWWCPKTIFYTTVPGPWYLRRTIYPQSWLKASVATLCTAGQTACIQIITFPQLVSPSTTEASQKQHNAPGTNQVYFQAPLLQVRIKGHRSDHPPKTEDGPHKIGNAIMRKHLAFPCVICKLLLAGMQHGRKQTSKPR